MIKSRPDTLPLGLLRRYIVAAGWHARSSNVVERFDLATVPAQVLLDGRTGGRRNVEIFVSDAPDLQGIELVVPVRLGSSDYNLLVARVIDALSAIEERSEEEIVRSIREIAFDVVRSRIPDTQVIDDAIHLDVARDFVVGIRNVLAATATTELRPTPYFLRLKKEAVEYADRCRFGHTFPR